MFANEMRERQVIMSMLQALHDLKESGCDDWQVLTSFVANLCLNQDDPYGMLQAIVSDAIAKMQMQRPLGSYIH